MIRQPQQIALAGLMMAGLLLSACAGQQPPQTIQTSATDADAHVTTATRPVDDTVIDRPTDRVAAPIPQHGPETTVPKASKVAKPAPKAPQPVPDYRTLVGLDKDGLLALLGKPKLLRRQPPAEVWQYAAPGCVLHVFLYTDGGNNRYAVQYVDAVHRRQQGGVQSVATGGRTLQQECYGRLLHQLTAQDKTS